MVAVAIPPAVEVAAAIPITAVADTEVAATKTSFFPTNYVSFFPLGPVSFSGDRAVFYLDEGSRAEIIVQMISQTNNFTASLCG